LATAYLHAREDKEDETDQPLATFPEVCPWVPEQVLDANFWLGRRLYDRGLRESLGRL
jgi:hypothetical protein